MKNLREVNDDILRDWFIYRDEDISALKSDEDKKHWIYFDEIAENILRNVPECNKKIAFIIKYLALYIKIFAICASILPVILSSREFKSL
jgi:hypothetical protein